MAHRASQPLRGAASPRRRPLRRRRRRGGKRQRNDNNAQPGRRLGPRRSSRTASADGAALVAAAARCHPHRARTSATARRRRARARRRAARGATVAATRGARSRRPGFSRLTRPRRHAIAKASSRPDPRRTAANGRGGRGRRGLLRGHARLLRGPRGRRCHERAARARRRPRTSFRRRVQHRGVTPVGALAGSWRQPGTTAAPGRPQGRAGRRRGLPLRAQAEPPRVLDLRRLRPDGPGPLTPPGACNLSRAARRSLM